MVLIHVPTNNKIRTDGTLRSAQAQALGFWSVPGLFGININAGKDQVLTGGTLLVLCAKSAICDGYSTGENGQHSE